MGIASSVEAIKCAPKSKSLLKVVKHAGPVDENSIQLLEKLLCRVCNFDGDTIWHLLAQSADSGALRNALDMVEIWVQQYNGLERAAFLLEKPPQDSKALLQELLNLRNAVGETPLHQACMLGRHENAGLLTSKGADPWIRDSGGGRTPLHIAAMRGHAQCVYSIMQALPEDLAMHGNSRLIDVRTDSGFTCLHYAVAHNISECVLAILSFKPDIHAANHGNGWFLPGQIPRMSTALHVAAWRGYVEMCKALLVHHAAFPYYHPAHGYRDPRLDVDIMSRTPFQVAQLKGNAAIARLLHPGYNLRVLSPRLDSLPQDDTSLVALAAAALKQKLMASVESAEAAHRASRQQQQQEAPASPTAGAGAGAGFGTGHSGPLGALTAPPSPSRGIQQHLALARADSTSSSGALALPVPQPRAGAAGSDREGSVRGGQQRLRSPSIPIHGASLLSRTSSSAVGAVGALSTSAPRGSLGRTGPGLGRVSRNSPTKPGSMDRQGSMVSISSSAKDPTRSDVACGVCWDNVATLSVGGCGHGMCGGCARHLVEGVRKRPLTCPFCRQIVRDFEPFSLFARPSKTTPLVNLPLGPAAINSAAATAGSSGLLAEPPMRPLPAALQLSTGAAQAAAAGSAAAPQPVWALPTTTTVLSAA